MKYKMNLKKTYSFYSI